MKKKMRKILSIICLVLAWIFTVSSVVGMTYIKFHRWWHGASGWVNKLAISVGVIIFVILAIAFFVLYAICRDKKG